MQKISQEDFNIELLQIINLVQKDKNKYDKFHSITQPMISYMYYKKFNGNSSLKADMESSADIALYKAFFIKDIDLQKINNISNYMYVIIYVAFLSVIYKEQKESTKQLELIQNVQIEDISVPDNFSYSASNTYYVDDFSDAFQTRSLQQDDKLIIYNRLLHKIRFFTKNEFKICAYLAALQVYDQKRYDYPLPKVCSNCTDIKFFINFIRVQYYIVLSELKECKII